MFGFLFRKKQDEVRGLLSGQMNRSFMRDMRFGKRRESRGYLFEVVYAIPYDETVDRPDFDRAFPIVTKDISAEGLSLIHNQPIEATRILVSIRQEMGRKYLACKVGHSTSLGCGFYQIGLYPEEIIFVDELTERKLQKRMDDFANRPTEKAESVGVS